MIFARRICFLRLSLVRSSSAGAGASGGEGAAAGGRESGSAGAAGGASSRGGPGGADPEETSCRARESPAEAGVQRAGAPRLQVHLKHTLALIDSYSDETWSKCRTGRAEIQYILIQFIFYLHSGFTPSYVKTFRYFNYP